jgi:hypothetical protein
VRGGDGAALAATARAEREKWTRLVRELGIKPESLTAAPAPSPAPKRSAARPLPSRAMPTPAAFAATAALLGDPAAPPCCKRC